MPITRNLMATAPAVLSYTQAADYLGMPSVGTLRALVYRRQGPPSICLGKRDRRFRVVDIGLWLEAKSKPVAFEVWMPCPPVARKRGRPTKVDKAARRAGPSG